MITYLDGEIVDKQPTRIVVDVGGVGYEVLISLCSYDRMPRCGERCKILTYDHVREDARILYGFMTEDERRMFVLLMSVSGIGPKLALCTLSGLSVRELRLAVVDKDVKRLSSISGVGKKMAERMIVELADKIGDAEILDAVAGHDDMDPETSIMRDSIMALIALGYQQANARKMVGQVFQKEHGDLTVEEVIKQALGG